MSEKFQVGQWVTCEGREACLIVAIGENGTVKVRRSENDAQWYVVEDVKPFRWEVGRTYQTTLDGVTAKVDAVISGRVWVNEKWRHATEQICMNNFHDDTGMLIGFEERDDVPHLLPYPADESPSVADTATEFSEFEDDKSDDHSTLSKLLDDAKYRRDMDQTQAEKWASRAAAWGEAVKLIEKALEGATT